MSLRPCRSARYHWDPPSSPVGDSGITPMSRNALVCSIGEPVLSHLLSHAATLRTPPSAAVQPSDAPGICRHLCCLASWARLGTLHHCPAGTTHLLVAHVLEQLQSTDPEVRVCVCVWLAARLSGMFSPEVGLWVCGWGLRPG